MLKGKSEEKINEVIENFMKTGEEALHGRIIRADKVKEYGLKVDIEDTTSNLWNFIWELVLRCENYLQQRGLAKYIVARNGGINIQIQLRKLG